MTSPESPRETFLDACALLLCLERADIPSAELLVDSYARSGELPDLLRAMTALAQTINHFAACASGMAPEKLLAAAIQEIRARAR